MEQQDNHIRVQCWNCAHEVHDPEFYIQGDNYWWNCVYCNVANKTGKIIPRNLIEQDFYEEMEKERLFGKGPVPAKERS